MTGGGQGWPRRTRWWWWRGAALAAWHGVVLAAAGLGALTVADLLVRRVRLGRGVPHPAVVTALLLGHLGTVLVVVGVVRPDLTA